MKRLRVGVLGLGAFGESHIRVYRSLPYVEIAAVASRSADRAAEIAARYDVPVWYGSHEELVADESVDAISVTTTEHEHRDPVVAALAAGKHVLVEKPLASTVENARAIVDAARGSSGFLMPAHILRFDPRYASARDIAVGGELGRVISISARRNRPQTLINTYSRVHPALITAIHDIDIMVWTAQAQVRRVYAIERLADRDNGAHGMWGMLEFANGTVGTLETSWLIPAAAGINTDDALQITGLEGTVKIQTDSPALRIWRPNGSFAPDVDYEPDLHGSIAGALRNELAYFADSALRRMPSTVISPQEGFDAVAVTLALIRAAKVGRQLILEDELGSWM